MPTATLENGLEIRVSAGSPGMPHMVFLRRRGQKQSSDYWVDVLRSDWGIGLRFRMIWDGVKQDFGEQVYDVNLDDDRATCECEGHLRHGTACKHILAARQLVGMGLVKPSPRPEQAEELPARHPGAGGIEIPMCEWLEDL